MRFENDEAILSPEEVTSSGLLSPYAINDESLTHLLKTREQQQALQAQMSSPLDSERAAARTEHARVANRERLLTQIVAYHLRRPID